MRWFDEAIDILGNPRLFGQLMKQLGKERMEYATAQVRKSSPDNPKKLFIAIARGRSPQDNELARANGVRPVGKTPAEIQQEIDTKRGEDTGWLFD